MTNVAGSLLKWMASSNFAQSFGRLLPERLRHLIWRTTHWVFKQRMMRERVDDKTILLADFPRSGVVWLRFLCATMQHYLITGEVRKLNTQEMRPYAPTLGGGEVHPERFFRGGNSVLKTHYRHHPKFKRGVVIYRNPFDAIKSIYALEEYQDSPVATLQSDQQKHLETLLLYWIKEYVEIYGSWLDAAKGRESDFLFLDYDELVADTEPFLADFYKFLGFDLSEFPDDAIHKLASMYSRSDAHRNTDEKLRRRAELQKLLEADISRDRLIELDPDLAARLDDLRAKLETHRLKPAAANA